MAVSAFLASVAWTYSSLLALARFASSFVSAFVTSDGHEVAFKIPSEAATPPPAAQGSGPNK